MSRGFHKSDDSSHELWEGKHKFEHWYRDNSIYFITARCRGRFPAFASEQAKSIFWARFEIAIAQSGFQPWVTSLLDNHCHTIGYLEHGLALQRMMHLLHGGVAKLVNDLLRGQCKAGMIASPLLTGDGRLLPFWVDSRRKNYMDGCLRDRKQGRHTYRYVLLQAVRHGIACDWRDYPHTRVCVGLDEAIAFALEKQAFLEDLPYKRYEGGGRRA